MCMHDIMYIYIWARVEGGVYDIVHKVINFKSLSAKQL